MNSKTKLFFPLALGLILASCGGNSSQPASVSSAASSTEAKTSEAIVDSGVITEDVTIYLMTNSSYQTTLDGIIEDFKAVEPHITVVNVKETGGYPDVKNKAISQLATGEHPDLLVAYPDSVEELMEYDAVVKLDDYIDNPVYGWSQEDQDDIVETYIEEGAKYPVPGVYSLPFAKSTEAMFYNKTVLIGLNLASVDPSINDGNPLSEAYLNNLTWEELFGKLCPAIVRYNESLDDDHKIIKGAKYAHSVFGYDSDDNLFITLAEQYGYPYTSINEYGEGSIDFVNNEMKGLMKTFAKAHKDGYFITKGSNNGDYTNYAFTDNDTLFSVGSTGGSKYQYSANFETGVAKIPHAAGKAQKVINQGPSLCILKHNEQRSLASWLFYKFLTNKENSTSWAIETGYSPIRYSVLDDEEFLDACDPEGKEPDERMKAITAKYATSIGNDLFASPVFKGSAEARSQVGALFTNCLLSDDLDNAIDGLFQTAYDNTLKAM
ncbi:MAG: extracellular solute-binding protein [Erysipelotrichaceae bacterium]|nr:extracellular solute-binding protein [Erysipelotrichaceae bacterium]